MTKRVTLAIGLLCMALGLQPACDDDKKNGGDGDGDGQPTDGSGDGDGQPGEGSPGDGDGSGPGDGGGDGGDGEPDGPTGTVTGFVFDTSSPPVALAGVRVVAPNGASATTDAQGGFSLDGVNVGASVVLLALEDDHSTGVRNVAVAEDAAGYVDFYLSGVTKTAFDPTKGGKVKTPNGATATFEPDSLTRKDGSGAPVGEVTVVVTAPDPVKGSGKKALPGSSGATKDGKSGAVETYSTMEVRVADSEGKELQVKADKKARLDFPVSGDVTLTPPQLDAWVFDEVTGRWNREGTSIKGRDDTGRVIYTTFIPHMSWWGSNAFIDDLTCMRGCVKDEAGAAVRGASVTITGVDFRFIESMSVGADGCFAVNVKQQSKVAFLAANAAGVSTPVNVASDAVEKQVEDGVAACQDIGDLTLVARQEGDCPPGYTNCDGTCIDLANDDSHCGPTCGTAVSCGFGNTPPYGGVCIEGKCACPVGWENCNGFCANTQTDSYYCGSCTGEQPCNSGYQEVCDNGVCTPLECGDLTVCGGRQGLGCADTNTSNLHCGECGVQCGKSIDDGQDLITTGYVCSEGRCDCEAGFDKCVPYAESPNNVVCADFDQDPTNCGGCYHDNDMYDEARWCNQDSEICSAGACTEITCPGAGGLACNRQCVDSLTDENNCGGCGGYCDTGTQCTGGECVAIVCDGETTLCGSDCVDLNTSAQNCGRCGHSCNGLACGDGACVCDQDQQVCCPETNVPYCSPIGSPCSCPIET